MLQAKLAALVAAVGLGGPVEAIPTGSVNAQDHVGSQADTDTIAEASYPDVGATSIVIDRETGAVLGSKHPNRRRAPASTTKMMTALLTIEAINDDRFTLDSRVVAQRDVLFEGGGQVGLAPGDNVSVRDLLYMALVKSGNDAATALGTYVGGSRDAFVALMNERAAELGLTNTSYVDISGRDPEDLGDEGHFPGQARCEGNDFDEPACAHYSTARDLAMLARYALDDPLFAQIVGRDSWTPFSWLQFSTGLWPHPALTNTNDLIVDGDSQFYEGAYGVKTGTSNMALSNLVSAAARTDCEGDGLCERRDVIAVVLGSTDDSSRFSDSRRLLDFGLAR
jgi:serine-type D-Ala-D-Ala carboxypeptidase (penicillin-binding protein 5/6)